MGPIIRQSGKENTRHYLNSLMLFGFVFISLCLNSCLSASATKALNKNKDRSNSLKVMTFNIHHANPPIEPSLIDIDGVVEIIRSQKADLVALQEVDSDTKRSGTGNQAEQIARKLGMFYFFGRAIPFDGGDYGVAILSRFPITEKQVLSLPSGNGEQRILALVKIQLPLGQEIAFGSTHLDHQGDAENRLNQIEKITEVVSSRDLPTIIGGDFNDTPGSEGINLLDKHFERSCRDCEATYPANNPEKAIDFIIIKDSNGKLSVKDHGVVQESKTSDHLPVTAEILLQP